MNCFTVVREPFQYTLLPMVFETYGGIAKDGRKLLRLLAGEAAEDPEAQKAFLSHAYKALSVCLQRGNAKIAKTYAQFLLTADAAARLKPMTYQRLHRSLSARSSCATTPLLSTPTGREGFRGRVQAA